ncbi:FAD-dependent oxidoreductase [Alkalihalophilus pseudofirmus]|uniref:FAD-dependent oxidoreductase n=1 Tax=Alkalihalophilus pseudofirmus TaxID=79885 RepID=A0AAJ2NLR1_ALKPS|nr:FAD-dependent oxidoreductase [Alkalihalophilus pseudofirmus]MDV2884718.1 FAD-dependent oxidoreductase [Alkalihalophilus pseudofirmus]
MGFVKDMLSIFNKRELLFLESYKESEDVYSFLFEKEKDLTWKAGQHGLFRITHRKIKKHTRPFTLASAPTEKMVKITMKINDNPSEFKKAMLELEQGMKINMNGPVGAFHLKDDGPTILIAAGIGITPFRSILKEVEANGNGIDKPIHLLYYDSNNSYIFKDELDRMAMNPLLNVTYLHSRSDLYQEIDKVTTLNKNGGKYYIAGPKSMVVSTSGYLQGNGISKRNINKDSFFGY